MSCPDPVTLKTIQECNQYSNCDYVWFGSYCASTSTSTVPISTKPITQAVVYYRKQVPISSGWTLFLCIFIILLIIFISIVIVRK